MSTEREKRYRVRRDEIAEAYEEGKQDAFDIWWGIQTASEDRDKRTTGLKGAYKREVPTSLLRARAHHEFDKLIFNAKTIDGIHEGLTEILGMLIDPYVVLPHILEATLPKERVVVHREEEAKEDEEPEEQPEEEREQEQEEGESR